MNKLFNKRSKLLFIVSLLESILTLWYLCYFNYLDRLNYTESIQNKTENLALLLENMYTSTFWGLIILTLTLICIFSIMSFIYKEYKYQFISISLWFTLLILAFNIKDKLINNFSTMLIFIPIITINIIAYQKQKKLT